MFKGRSQLCLTKLFSICVIMCTELYTANYYSSKSTCQRKLCTGSDTMSVFGTSTDIAPASDVLTSSFC